ncbi:MAG: ATP-binding cassette domain-containing protein [Treponema sp.]|nr:ATP-binding cassette domain-containing protein [Treponema sp.]
MIELRNISKTYPGGRKKANNNITLDLRDGEILCIAGENGAGKTTLMKILCGLEKPDTGEILIDGKKPQNNSQIGMVHQHFMLFPDYTVSENIVMGNEPRKYGIFFDTQKAKKVSEEIINDNNFSIKSEKKVNELTLGEMQQVEICRILYQNAQTIILDEPTSILTENETQSLFKTLKTLVKNGKSIVLITHKLREIKQIADRVAILRRGEVMGVRNVEDADHYEIARLMTGSNAPLELVKKSEEKSAVRRQSVIVFDNVTVRRKGQQRPLLDKVSFSVSSGEILGFAGVGGNGLGVIEAVLGGFLHPESGRILHREKDISALNIEDLRAQGLAFVPADRVNIGSAREATIEENMIINRRKELAGTFFLAERFTSNLVNNFSIETHNLKEKVLTLSGGNLQKLILAREIDWFNDYIVFSEPTWGLDIAASRFVMGEIDALRNRGAAVILISTNLDEIFALADRIIVMYRGMIAGTFTNSGSSIKTSVENCMQGLGAGE